MKIVYLGAGAADMYCGSCLRDNSLATELISRGHQVTLLPVYTPTLTDEPNVSHDRAFLREPTLGSRSVKDSSHDGACAQYSEGIAIGVSGCHQSRRWLGHGHLGAGALVVSCGARERIAASQSA